TVLFGGLGFALAYGPLNIAATNGIAAEEQGLASGLVNTSFQFGGALVLAIATAVNNAANGSADSPQALLDGFRAAAVVSIVAAGLGVAVTALRFGARRVREVGGETDVCAPPQREAAWGRAAEAPLVAASRSACLGSGRGRTSAVRAARSDVRPLGDAAVVRPGSAVAALSRLARRGLAHRHRPRRRDRYGRGRARAR